VTLDSHYAAAWAGLARALNQSADFTTSTAELSVVRERAMQAAERAVETDPGLADGYGARANVRTYLGYNWTGAEADFKRALELNAGDTFAHVYYSRLLYRLGRLDEAIAEARRATELEPLWPQAKNILGAFYNAAGRLEEARQVLTTALEISPKNEYGAYFLGTTLLLQGHPEEALALCTPASTPFRKAMLAMAEHDLGDEPASRKALNELIAESGETNAFHIAQVYARRGERDKAFEWLERAYAHHESQLPTMVSEPLIGSVRNDPRFATMLQKLKTQPSR
jgi:serine/threonine-protein kinase